MTAAATGASPARAAAHRVVLRALEGAYADRALHGEARDLDPRDRAQAKRLAFGTVQRRGTLDWAVGRLVERRLDPPVRAALHLGLYELAFAGTPAHAVVAQAVELAKPSPGAKLVNAVLRRVAREGLELPADDTPAGAAIRHGHPAWLVERWWSWLGPDETRALLAADNEPAPTVLRLNALHPEAGALVADLAGIREGDTLTLTAPADLLHHPAYAAGACTPQSAASQRVARTVDPQPGERVLDLCAAPGGKTAHLAALMGDRGTVVAVERAPQRAQALERNVRRLRATCVEVRCQDAREAVAGGPFDRVLLDPPCSGLGTLRGHPDLRWRVTPEDVERLAALQRELLDAARAALAPGGRLVFSVCTLSPPEEVAGEPAWRTFPHRDGTDGFSVAVGAGD
jgi:16S rRNA (cytosine967-C5)-methyltransferase